MQVDQSENAAQTQMKAIPLAELHSRRSAMRILGLAAAGIALGAIDPAQAEAKKAKRYKIVYKLNKGKRPAGYAKYVKRGKRIAVGKLPKPKRKGYKFAGWYANSKLTKKASYVYGKPATSKRRIYAKWKIVTYSISYDAGGGKLPSGLAKTYKVTTKTFSLKKATRNGYVFSGWYTHPVSGTKVSKVKKGSAGNLALYARWTGGPNWDAHMAAKMSKINGDVSAMGGNGDSFVFITDMHWEHNSQLSPSRIQEVVRKTPVRKVMLGGDVLTWRKTREKALAVHTDFRDQLKAFASEVYFTRGNHDTNEQDSRASSSSFLNDAELRSIWSNAWMEKTAPSKTALYYYMDNSAAKIRYLFLDSGHKAVESTDTLGAAQLNWAKARITELPKGWSVMVFQHMFLRDTNTAKQIAKVTSKQKNGKLVRDMLDGIADSCNATIIGVMCGHCHYDAAVQSSKGYWIIMTGTDSLGIYNKTWNGAMVKGSSGEQRFDVVVLDKGRRTLKLTRIGYGVDREFKY